MEPMKSSEEVKKGLECCENPNNNPTICEECPYKDTRGSCIDRLYMEARKCIQQLEADNSRKDDTIRSLTELLNAAHEETASVKREREAMLEEMRMFHYCCSFCKHNLLADGCAVTPDPAKRTCFEWRGVCPENTEVQEDA